MSPQQSADPIVDPPSPKDVFPDLEASQDSPERTPVPKLQLLSLCISRIAEPLAYTQTFPYVNQMIWELGVTDDPTQVGFYSGLIDSAFAFAQMFTTYGYGTLSGNLPNRPKAGGTLGNVWDINQCSALWHVKLFRSDGACEDVWQVNLPPLLDHATYIPGTAGLLSGYAAATHSALGEITDETNQAAAYTLYGLCYPIGSLVGPLVGGALAKPNEKIPHLVPALLHDLFDKYPYILPGMAASAIAMLSLFFVFFFMKETLPSVHHIKQRDFNGNSTPSSLYGARGRTTERASSSSTSASSLTRYSSTSTHIDDYPKKLHSETCTLLADGYEPRVWTVWKLLELPELRKLYQSAIVLSFFGEAYAVVFLLFSYTKIQHGGLGFGPVEIGFVLATSGGVGFALQTIVLPVLLERFNLQKSFKACMSLFPIAFAIPPVLSVFARISSDNGQHTIGTEASVVIWIGVWAAQGLFQTACMAYPLNMVIVRQSAPDNRALGATNGLNKLSQCAARMLAPVLVNALFAFSTQHNLLGGYFVWVVMVAVSIMGWRVV